MSKLELNKPTLSQLCAAQTTAQRLALILKEVYDVPDEYGIYLDDQFFAEALNHYKALGHLITAIKLSGKPNLNS